MIRFIYIGDQITDDHHDFAWWNTVTNTFLEFNGECVWRSWEEFERDYDGDEIERFRSLFPEVLEIDHDGEGNWNQFKEYVDHRLIEMGKDGNVEVGWIDTSSNHPKIDIDRDGYLTIS